MEGYTQPDVDSDTADTSNVGFVAFALSSQIGAMVHDETNRFQNMAGKSELAAVQSWWRPPVTQLVRSPAAGLRMEPQHRLQKAFFGWSVTSSQLVCETQAL